MVLSVHHMWVEFVVGPLLCSERFLSGYSGFPLSSKTNIFKFQFDQESGRRITTIWMYHLQIVIYLFIYIKLDINYKRTANEHAAQSRTYKKTFSAKFIQSRHIEFCKADRIT